MADKFEAKKALNPLAGTAAEKSDDESVKDEWDASSEDEPEPEPAKPTKKELAREKEAKLDAKLGARTNNASSDLSSMTEKQRQEYLAAQEMGSFMNDLGLGDNSMSDAKSAEQIGVDTGERLRKAYGGNEYFRSMATALVLEVFANAEAKDLRHVSRVLSTKADAVKKVEDDKKKKKKPAATKLASKATGGLYDDYGDFASGGGGGANDDDDFM